MGGRVEDVSGHPHHADVAGLPPSSGLQFFGEVTIDASTGVMAVTLRDRAGAARHTVTIDPQR